MYAARMINHQDGRHLARIDAAAFWAPWPPAQFEAVCCSASTHGCVVRHSETLKPIGYCVFEQYKWRVEITRIAVECEHRRRGVGLEMLDYISRWTNQRDIPKITTLVHEDRHDAIAFFSAMGFEATAVKRGEDGDRIAMRLVAWNGSFG